MGRPELFIIPRTRLGDEEIALASTLEALLEREVRGRRLELKEDYAALLEPALKRIMVEVGLQRMFWPESAGGDGCALPGAAYAVVSALEQVARADTGLAFVVAHNLALQACLNTGEGIKAETAARTGSTFCASRKPLIVSFVLPAYGRPGDTAGEWEGKYFQVSGSLGGGQVSLRGKSVRPTCSGAGADLFAAWCSLDGEEQPALVLIPGDAPGLIRGREFTKMGLAASRNADIDLEDVRLEESCIAGRGAGVLRCLLSWYYLGLAATAAGSLLAAYEIIREWGDSRVIKGRGMVFKENPLTAALMAETAQETAAVRLLCYDLAEVLAEPGAYGEAGSPCPFTYASMLAHRAFRGAEGCLHHIMELMASAGYAKEWQLERYWRDLKTVQCYLGSYELAKMQYARWFFGCETL